MAEQGRTVVLILGESRAAGLAALLREQGLREASRPFALVAGAGPGVSATLYRGGKLVIQGKAVETLLAAITQAWPELFAAGTEAWIGTDESGKGDFFGPLVVAAVRLVPDLAQQLVMAGVRDCKQLSDRAVTVLEPKIREVAPHEVVVIGPERYNELYRKFKNLNRLLAWGHARAIESLLDRAPAPRVVADRFGDESLILSALMEKGRSVVLEQRHRAEDDPAVAAASVLARSEFLRRLDRLQTQVGISLPKGASEEVERVARELAKRGGESLLGRVAKLHFKTASRALEQV